MLRVSLRTNLFMTQEDQIFVVDAMVIDVTHEIVASNVISQPTCAATKFNTIVKIRKYRGLYEEHYLFQWPWRCMVHIDVI